MSEETPQNAAEAMEQFDLTHGMEFDLTPEEVGEFANRLEQAEAADLSKYLDEDLADMIHALKRLEDAVEEARKEHFEAELDERVPDGAQIGPVAKTTGRSTYVTDDEAALHAVMDAGGDPTEVVSVKASKLQDVGDALGLDVSEYIGESEYTYFRRTG